MNADINLITSESEPIKSLRGNLCDFKVITKKPITFSLLEFELQIPNLPKDLNVYYEKDLLISVDAVSESGKHINTRAFYFEEYEYGEDNEIIGRTEKAPCFRIRVNPQEEGLLKIGVTLLIHGEKIDSIECAVSVEKNCNGSQILRVEPKEKKTFIKASGEKFTVLGENVGWNFPIQHHHCFGQYIINHMTALSRCNGNFIRTWDYLECGSRIRATTHTMRQDSSAMWDKIFEKATDMDVYVSLVMTVHGEVSSIVDSSFLLSVWHENNGGFITDAKDFFVDERSKDGYKAYIQYILARWGYNEHIIWELFNEVDHTDAMMAGNLNDVAEWLTEMSEYIRKFDPYAHLVTNSVGGVSIASALYKPFDFVYYHQYNPYSIGQIADLHREAARAYERPVLIGEHGYDGVGIYHLNGDAHISEDLLILHQGIWAGLMGGGAGGAMNWWWMDMSGVDGYRSYIGASAMAKRIHLCNDSLTEVTKETININNSRIEVLGYLGSCSAYLWL